MVGAILAGCTGTSGVNTQTLDPISTSTASSSTVASSTEASPSQISASPSPSPAAQSVTSGIASGLSVEESADRAAVESQWVKSWDVYLEIARTPAADREALIATVAVDPTKANMLSDAAKFDSQGLETYGSLNHPGFAGDSTSWEGWGHGEKFGELPEGAARARGPDV